MAYDDPTQTSNLMKPPVSNFAAMNPMGGSSKRIKKMEDEDPNSINRSPVKNPLVKGGNEGLNNYMSLHRGSRGEWEQKGNKIRYTGGAFKGKTRGQADVEAFQKWEGMDEMNRDRFRSKNTADIARERDLTIQGQMDEAAVARATGVTPRSKTLVDPETGEEIQTQGANPKGDFKPDTAPTTPPVTNPSNIVKEEEEAPASASTTPASPVKKPTMALTNRERGWGKTLG